MVGSSFLFPQLDRLIINCYSRSVLSWLELSCFDSVVSSASEVFINSKLEA